MYRLWHPGMEWTQEHLRSLPGELKVGDLSGAQRFIDSIQDQEWYKQAFPFRPTERTRALGFTGNPRVEVRNWSTDNPGQKPTFLAQAVRSTNLLSKPYSQSHTIELTDPLEHSGNKLVLLHELSHIADTIPGEYRADHHGPTFLGSMVHMVHHALGSDASAALRYGYSKEGLDWSSDAVHPDARLPELAGAASRR